MYCKKCGKQIPDDSNVCQYCGEVLNYDGLSNTVNVNNNQNEKKIKSLKLIVTIVALVAVVAIVFSVVSCVNNSKNSESQNSVGTLETATEKPLDENPDKDIDDNADAETESATAPVTEPTTKTKTTTKKPQVTETADAVDYIGKTYGDVFKKYGTNFSLQYINGGNFVTCQKSDILFGVVPFYDDNVTADRIKNEKITGIFVFGDTRVYKNFFAEMSYAQLKAMAPYMEGDGMYHNEMDDNYGASFVIDGYRLSYTWLEDPRNGQLSDWVYVMRY